MKPTDTLRNWINPKQLAFMVSCTRREEGEWFTAKMRHLAGMIEAMPKVYEQDGKGDATVVYLHYFRGSADAWITERDTTPEQEQAYGYVDLGYGREAGYIYLPELLEAGMELDLHFGPCAIGDLWKSRAAA